MQISFISLSSNYRIPGSINITFCFCLPSRLWTNSATNFFTGRASRAPVGSSGQPTWSPQPKASAAASQPAKKSASTSSLETRRMLIRQSHTPGVGLKAAVLWGGGACLAKENWSVGGREGGACLAKEYSREAWDRSALSRVADPDPYWIRIQEVKNDPQK